MVGIMDSEAKHNIAEQRENLLKLMEDKSKLETEIRTLACILEQNGVGMSEPLVDGQGFPRNDIDVYRVRHARHSIICLRNDLKAVMETIEKGLHTVHAAASNTDVHMGSVTTAAQNGGSMEPIARIKSVVPDSPAFISGLLSDDLIVEFGTVNGNNFKSLEDISRVVQHSVNSNVNLIVRRGHSVLSVNLCPKQWSGRGLLGCTIVPIDSGVER